MEGTRLEKVLCSVRWPGASASFWLLSLTIVPKPPSSSSRPGAAADASAGAQERGQTADRTVWLISARRSPGTAQSITFPYDALCLLALKALAGNGVLC